MKPASLLRLVFGALALASLAACGGRGSDTAAPVPTTAASTPSLAPTTATPAAGSPASVAPTTTAATSTTRAATTTTAAPTTTRPVLPLRIGDHHPLVTQVQDKLRTLGYDPGPSDGQFGAATLNAVWAFQRVNGLTPDGDVGPLTMAALDAPKQVAPMVPDGPADRVEISISRQLLVLYLEGKPKLISHVSSGSRVPFCENGVCGDAVTPLGDYTIIHKISGWEEGPLGSMYNSMYFWPAYAIHGSPNVPDVGASHGCVRVPMHIADYLTTVLNTGFAVHIQEA